MKSISQTTQQMESISKKTSAFFRRYHVGQILRSANACKLKGFSAILVFLQLVSIIFENRSSTCSAAFILLLFRSARIRPIVS